MTPRPWSSLDRVLAIHKNNIYDLSDHLQTLSDNNGGARQHYLDGDLIALLKQQPGQGP